MYGLACDSRDVDWLNAREPVLTNREIEERVDEPALLVAAGNDALGHRAPCDRVRARIGKRCFRERELKRDWSAQLVRNVRGEASS